MVLFKVSITCSELWDRVCQAVLLCFAFLRFFNALIYNRLATVISIDVSTSRQNKQFVDITLGSGNLCYALVIEFDILQDKYLMK